MSGATLTGQMMRFARVGAGLGGFAAGAAVARAGGRELADARNAAELRRILGDLKGPIMKIAQVLGNIPDAVPPQYAAELAKLQAHAPPMGSGFVRRRMAGELGPDWARHFAHFPLQAAAAASLGQVHRARLASGKEVAVKLQYPDMASAVEADLGQLDLLLALFRRIDRSIDPSEIRDELAARLREELDYGREARHAALYRALLADDPRVRVPKVYAALSTPRLLTLDWLEGRHLLQFREHPLEVRNRIAEALFLAWYRPFYCTGVLHGDPHLGNYSVAAADGDRAVINLVDFGCVRIFPPRFLEGVNELYHAIEADDEDRAFHAFGLWGFRGLTRETMRILLVWARFLYGPLLDDRVRPIDENRRPGEYGRAIAMKVHAELRRTGTVRIPAEFVFMDRAAIGLGGVFIQLGAELNWSALFRGLIDGFDRAALAARQREALEAVGLAPPADPL
ncbi:MAG: AarF/ABC1/UbiB kinase family protein [Sphingomonadaceae bacterium]|uniref:ABC1 kinase family protein n=1 Tax=Thermaurantiacus sp. TaxID=2820283 RepID=UPI00298F2EEB|nr:AarF/ABC1/UbiB kinase family protein [Thermaurantiacus sp.]MCS6986808.1 AarF/ABC1/UbiB kinase family protein [Sphingomonadaceae bacterium]MDW8413929.1 AarF/ABC1/UbiB kinase family protein [Thermaurantiacus sp.]